MAMILLDIGVQLIISIMNHKLHANIQQDHRHTYFRKTTEHHHHPSTTMMQMKLKKLENTIKKTPRKDILIIQVDRNAKAGPDTYDRQVQLDDLEQEK